MNRKYVRRGEEFLYHHGIKGQKWGVRRYQNKDGSYTALGKARRKEGEKLKDFNLKKSQVMLGKTPATKYEYRDKDGKLAAEFKTWDWWDGINISDLEIYEPHKGKRLSYQILDYATKELGVKNLAVRKNNAIAKHVYDVYGFKITDQDDEMYYMSLEDDKEG